MKKGSPKFRFSCSGNQMILAVSMVAMIFISCERDYFYQVPPPHVATATTTLNAQYASKVPLSVTDKFWNGVDYLKVSVQNLNTDSLYGDGLLNMTGTKSGLPGFNAGKNPEVTMKAVYDETKLYVYLQWTDSDQDPKLANSMFNGPVDPLKSDSPLGWTSQGNSDRVALAFDLGGASSAAGTFVQKGCAASCHNNKMKPEAGKVDIWSWSLAVSDPLGYACDMVADATSGLTNDGGQAMFVRNKIAVANNRSAPGYEWDGTVQTVTRPDGKTTALDPAYYLYNKVPFTGDAVAGLDLYDNAVQCAYCHGKGGVGYGTGGYGPAFANFEYGRKFSREEFRNYAGNDKHDGATQFNSIDAGLQNDLVAYIKGLGGVPGYYLTKPSGSNADIWSVSNVSRARISITPHTVYQVLLIRNLTTNNGDDIQFTSPAGKSFPFGIALMDSDGKNHIGSLKEELKFKPKGQY